MNATPRYSLNTAVATLATLTLLVVGCAADPAQPDYWEWDDGAESIEQLPMPEQTRAVFRINPEQLDGVIAESGLDQRDADDVVPTETRLVAWWLQHPDRAVVAPADWLFGAGYDETVADQHAFDALDTSRSMVVSVTSRNAEDQLRYLRYRLPLVSYHAQMSRDSLRVFIPAEDAGELKAQLEAHCEHEDANCRFVERFSTHDDYAVVDVSRSALGASSRVDQGETMDRRFDDLDHNYWSDPTVAAHAFLTGDHAVALYTRSEDIPALGAIAGVSELMEALERATPGSGQRLMQRGAQMAATTLVMSAPDVREYEDLAMTVHHDPEASKVTGDLVRTFTEHGASISEPSGPVEPPSRSDDEPKPVLHFEWAAPEGKSPQQLDLPDWADHPEMGAAGLAETFRDGGVWAYWTVLAGYPRAGAAMIDAVNPTQESMLGSVKSVEMKVGQKRVEQLLARLDDPTASFQGHREAVMMQMLAQAVEQVVLRVEPSGQWDMLIGQLEEMLAQLGADLVVDVQRQEDQKIIAITPEGADSIADSPGVAAGSTRLELNTSELTELLREASDHIGDHPEMLESLQFLDATRIRHATFKEGTLTRMTTGTDSEAELAMPPVDYQPRQVDAETDCLQEVQSLYLSYDNPFDLSPFERIDAIADVMDELGTLQDRCDGDDDSAKLQWVQSRWNAIEGLFLAQSYQWDDAASRFEDACSEYPAACRDAEQLREHSADWELPGVEHPASVVDSGGLSETYLGPDSGMASTPSWFRKYTTVVSYMYATDAELTVDASQLFFWEYDDDTALHKLPGVVPEAEHLVRLGARTEDGEQQVAHTPDGEPYRYGAMALDAEFPANRLPELTALAAEREAQPQSGQMGMRGSDAKGYDQPPMLGTLVDSSEHPDAVESVILWGAVGHLEETDRPVIDIKLHEEGATVSYDGGVVSEERSVSELAEILESVADEHDEAPDGEAVAFSVELHRDLPLSELVEVHAELGAWTDEYSGARALVVPVLP